MAMVAAEKSNISFQQIVSTIKKMKPVNGRLEKIGYLKNNSCVILDYAHTPDAIKVCLSNLKDQFNALGKQVLSRSFNNQEQILLAKLLREHIEEFESNPSEADKLVSIGLTPVPSEIQKVELAAWISVARAVLNLHETITRN